jgi:hypothetical protein
MDETVATKQGWHTGCSGLDLWTGERDKNTQGASLCVGPW